MGKNPLKTDSTFGWVLRRLQGEDRAAMPRDVLLVLVKVARVATAVGSTTGDIWLGAQDRLQWGRHWQCQGLGFGPGFLTSAAEAFLSGDVVAFINQCGAVTAKIQG